MQSFSFTAHPNFEKKEILTLENKCKSISQEDQNVQIFASQHL